MYSKEMHRQWILEQKQKAKERYQKKKLLKQQQSV